MSKIWIPLLLVLSKFHQRGFAQAHYVEGDEEIIIDKYQGTQKNINVLKNKEYL